jgi:hypothetical protein
MEGKVITIHDTGPDWLHPVKSKISAGGPGSGRHKGFGTQKVPKNKFGQPIVSTKQKTALQHYSPTGTKEQRKADWGESLVKNAIDGSLIGTNSEPFDVLSKDGKHAIEVKTLVKQGNNKITMKGSAMERKYGWALKNKKQIHTIVLDMRNGSSVPSEIYHREGVGSFRLDNMNKLGPGKYGLDAIDDAIHGR